MDRGHRALLALVAGILSGGAPGLFAAPPPTPATTPSVQATPVPRAGFGSPMNPVGPTAPEQGPRERIKAAMMDVRARELNDTAGVSERLARMNPDERETFKRNLKVWQGMPQEERMALRKQANERNREEILGALKEIGLQLNDDQKEVFALRYLQERRKMERALLEQANAERARRLPQILQGLKHEFTADKDKATDSSAPTPSVSTTPAAH